MFIVGYGFRPFMLIHTGCTLVSLLPVIFSGGDVQRNGYSCLPLRPPQMSLGLPFNQCRLYPYMNFGLAAQSWHDNLPTRSFTVVNLERSIPLSGFHFPFPPLRCIVLHRPLNILPHLLATSFNRHFPLQHLERTRLRLFLPEIGCVSLFLFSFDPQSFRLCFCAGCYFLITVRNRRQVPRMGIFL